MCFARELKAQKHTKSGQGAIKRRKYVYFDRLLFLLPDVEQRQTESNLSPVHGNSDDVEVTDEVRPTGEDQDVHVPQTARRLSLIHI